MSKKIVIIWISFVITALSFVLLVNYKVDSLQLFSNSEYLKNAAKDIVSGHIIGGLKDFDERLFVKNIIENTHNEPDFIAIGSSRTMQLRKRMFLDNNKTFFNLSVSGASLEDYIGIVSTYQMKHKKLPKNIIIGIDPWIFNKNNGQDRYLSLYDEYNIFIKDNNLLKYTYDKQQKNNLPKLISFDYFKVNALFLFDYFTKGYYGYYTINSVNKNDYLRETDASIQYPYDKRKPNELKVENLAIGYTKGQVYSLENFSSIDNVRLFEYFIKYLKKNSNVYLFLPPYNPLSYDILIRQEDKYQIINVEKYLRKFAYKNDIKLIGSYNPHEYGLTSSDFFDGMHPLDDVYIKIFNKMDTKE